MRYSIEPRDRIYGNRYVFLSFTKNMSDKYGQKPFDRAKKSTTDERKTASKRAIQKAAEATGDLIGNKIADKVVRISKKPVKELPINEEGVELATHKRKIYMARRKTANY